MLSRRNVVFAVVLVLLFILSFIALYYLMLPNHILSKHEHDLVTKSIAQNSYTQLQSTIKKYWWWVDDTAVDYYIRNLLQTNKCLGSIYGKDIHGVFLASPESLKTAPSSSDIENCIFEQ
jgi:hypothetical protein